MIEITPKTTPKITPTSIATSIATSLGTPDPATATTMPNVTTDLETIGRNKKECIDTRHPKCPGRFRVSRLRIGSCADQIRSAAHLLTPALWAPLGRFSAHFLGLSTARGSLSVRENEEDERSSNCPSAGFQLFFCIQRQLDHALQQLIGGQSCEILQQRRMTSAPPPNTHIGAKPCDLPIDKLRLSNDLQAPAAPAQSRCHARC